MFYFINSTMCTIQMQCRLQLSVDSVTAQDNWNDLLIHSDLWRSKSHWYTSYWGHSLTHWCSVCAQYCMVISKEWTWYWTLYYMSQTVVLHCMCHSLPWFISTLPHALYKAMSVQWMMLLIWPFIANGEILHCENGNWFVAIYTPGRGKIVPHNVTLLVGEKLFYVM